MGRCSAKAPGRQHTHRDRCSAGTLYAHSSVRGRGCGGESVSAARVARACAQLSHKNRRPNKNRRQGAHWGGERGPDAGCWAGVSALAAGGGVRAASRCRASIRWGERERSAHSCVLARAESFTPKKPKVTPKVTPTRVQNRPTRQLGRVTHAFRAARTLASRSPPPGLRSSNIGSCTCRGMTAAYNV